MSVFMEALCALLVCAPTSALAGLVVVLFNSGGRLGRWWRFRLGLSRNKRRDEL